MEKSLVSVVLGVYNGEKYLTEQIDSILRQTYRPLELIISDDASTDKTRQILKQYESNPLIRIYYQEKNIGITKNFAFAAEKAKGDLIAFSDHDDIWMENKIQKLVNAINDSPLVYSDSLLMDENGMSLDKKLSDLKKMYSGDDSRGYILSTCVWGHGMLITRKLLEKSLPMPDEIHHDIWIAFQAFLHGGIKYLDEVLTHYRQHTYSTSKTLPQKQPARKKKGTIRGVQEKISLDKTDAAIRTATVSAFLSKTCKIIFTERKRLCISACVIHVEIPGTTIYVFKKRFCQSPC